MSSEGDLKARGAAAAETVVPGGTGSKSGEAKEGGQTRPEQLGHDGHAETGKTGGLSNSEQVPGGAAAAKDDLNVDDAKFASYLAK